MSGSGTALTGVDVSFDDTTKVSGSGVDYSGFAVATVSGNATALTGVATSFDDATQVSGSGITLTIPAKLAFVEHAPKRPLQIDPRAWVASFFAL